jgi:hypothetical protein
MNLSITYHKRRSKSRPTYTDRARGVRGGGNAGKVSHPFSKSETDGGLRRRMLLASHAMNKLAGGGLFNIADEEAASINENGQVILRTVSTPR